MTLSITKKDQTRQGLHLSLLVSVYFSLLGCSNLQWIDDANDKSMRGAVYVPDGSKQCEASTQNIALFRQQLENNGVDVIQQRCGHITGVSFPAVCGAQNGKVYTFVVNDVELATQAGFKSVNALPEGQEIVANPCPKMIKPEHSKD